MAKNMEFLIGAGFNDKDIAAIRKSFKSIQKDVGKTVNEIEEEIIKLPKEVATNAATALQQIKRNLQGVNATNFVAEMFTQAVTDTDNATEASRRYLETIRDLVKLKNAATGKDKLNPKLNIIETKDATKVISDLQKISELEEKIEYIRKNSKPQNTKSVTTISRNKKYKDGFKGIDDKELSKTAKEISASNPEIPEAAAKNIAMRYYAAKSLYQSDKKNISTEELSDILTLLNSTSEALLSKNVDISKIKGLDGFDTMMKNIKDNLVKALNAQKDSMFDAAVEEAIRRSAVSVGTANEKYVSAGISTSPDGVSEEVRKKVIEKYTIDKEDTKQVDDIYKTIAEDFTNAQVKRNSSKNFGGEINRINLYIEALKNAGFELEDINKKIIEVTKNKDAINVIGELQAGVQNGMLVNSEEFGRLDFGKAINILKNTNETAKNNNVVVNGFGGSNDKSGDTAVVNGGNGRGGNSGTVPGNGGGSDDIAGTATKNKKNIESIDTSALQKAVEDIKNASIEIKNTIGTLKSSIETAISESSTSITSHTEELKSFNELLTNIINSATKVSEQAAGLQVGKDKKSDAANVKVKIDESNIENVKKFSENVEELTKILSEIPSSSTVFLSALTNTKINPNVAERLSELTKSIKKFKIALSDIPEGSNQFLNSINSILEKGEALKDLTNVLTSSVSKIKNAGKAVGSKDSKYKKPEIKPYVQEPPKEEKPKIVEFPSKKEEKQKVVPFPTKEEKKPEPEPGLKLVETPKEDSGDSDEKAKRITVLEKRINELQNLFKKVETTEDENGEENPLTDAEKVAKKFQENFSNSALYSKIENKVKSLSYEKSTSSDIKEIERLINVMKSDGYVGNINNDGKSTDRKSAMNMASDYLKNIYGAGESKIDISKSWKVGANGTESFTASIVTASNEVKKFKFNIQDGIMSVQDLGAAAQQQATPLQSAAEILSKKFKDVVVYWTAMYLNPYQLIGKFKSMIDQAAKFNDTFVQISYTMDVSKQSLNNLGAQSIKTANDLSVSLDNMNAVLAVYSNMQTTTNEMLKEAEPTLILSNLSGQAASTSADQLQGIVNEFDLSQKDMMHIVDVMDYVSADMRMDFTKGINVISEATAASGLVAKNAGMDFETYAAMVGKASEISRQSGSELGNATKMIFTRISKASKLDGDVNNAEISDAAAALKNIGIDVYSKNGEFQDINVTLSQLASKWDALTDAQRSNISYAVAGTRQINTLGAILKSYASAQDLAAEAKNADGVAADDQAKKTESLSGKLQILDNTWKSVSYSLGDNEGLKVGIELLTSLAKIFSDVAKNGLATVTSIVGITSAINTLKKGSDGGFWWRTNPDAEHGFEYTGLLSPLRKGLKSTAIRALSENELNALPGVNGDFFASFNNSTESAADFAKAIGMSSTHLEKYLITVKKGEASLKGYNEYVEAVNKSLIGTGRGAKIAAAGLNILTNIGVSLIISGIIMLVEKWINESKEAINAAKEMASQLSEQRVSLQNSKKTIDELSREYFDLSAGVDDLGRNVSLSTDQYSRYNEITTEIAGRFPELIKGYTDEGTAILATRDNVNALTEAYKKQKEALKNDTISNSGVILKGFEKQTKVGYTGFELILNPFLARYADKNSATRLKSLEYYRDNGYSMDGIDPNSVAYSAIWQATNGRAIYDTISKTEIDALISQYESKVDASVATVKPIMQAFLESDSKFTGLPQNVQDQITKFVQNTKYEFYEQLKGDDGKLTIQDMQAWIDNLLSGLNADGIKNFDIAIDAKTKFNDGDMSYGQFYAKIEALKKLFPEDVQRDIEIIFKVDDNGVNIEDTYKDVKNKLGDRGLDPTVLNGLNNLNIDKIKQLNTLIGEGKINAGNISGIGSLKELSDLIDKLVPKIKDAEKGYTSFLDAIKGAQSSNETYNEVVKDYADNQKYSLSTLQKIVEIYPDLQANVYKYIAGQKTAASLMKDVSDKSKEASTITKEAFKDMYYSSTDVSKDIVDNFSSAFNEIGLKYNNTKSIMDNIGSQIIDSNGIVTDTFKAQWEAACAASGISMMTLAQGYSDIMMGIAYDGTQGVYKKNGVWYGTDYKHSLTNAMALKLKDQNKNLSSSEAYKQAGKLLDAIWNKAKESNAELEKYRQESNARMEELARQEAEKALKERAKKEKEYAKKRRKLERQLQEAIDNDHLEALKGTMALADKEIEKFTKQAEIADWGEKFLNESSFGSKSEMMAIKLGALSQEGEAIRNEMERLMALEPQSANEAVELANKIDSLGQSLRTNATNTREAARQLVSYRIEALKIASVDYFDKAKNSLDVLKNELDLMNGISADSNRYTAQIMDISLLYPTLSDFKDPIKRKEAEDREIVKLEIEKQNEINRISKDAIDKQNKYNAQKRAEEIQDIKDEIADLNDEIAEFYGNISSGFDSTMGKIEDSYNATKSNIENNQIEIKPTVDASALDEVSDKVDALAQKMKNTLSETVYKSISSGTAGRSDLGNNVEVGSALRGYNLSEQQDNIVRTAMKYVGGDYQWGGKAPTYNSSTGMWGGFDCSGLVTYALGIAGINAAQGTVGLYTDKRGKFVNKNEMLPGDIILFLGEGGTTASPQHAAVYVGNGMMAEAHGKKYGIEFRPVSARNDFVAAKRFWNESAEKTKFYATGTSGGSKIYDRMHIAGENYKPEIMVDKKTGEMNLVSSPTQFDISKKDIIGEKDTRKLLHEEGTSGGINWANLLSSDGTDLEKAINSLFGDIINGIKDVNKDLNTSMQTILLDPSIHEEDKVRLINSMQYKAYYGTDGSDGLLQKAIDNARALYSAYADWDYAVKNKTIEATEKDIRTWNEVLSNSVDNVNKFSSALNDVVENRLKNIEDPYNTRKDDSDKWLSFNENMKLITGKEYLSGLARVYKYTQETLEDIQNDPTLDELTKHQKLEEYYDKERNLVEQIYSKSIELYTKLYSFRIEKEEALKDIKQSEFDLVNKTYEYEKDANKALATSLIGSQYLDPDTRKLVYNEDDYKKELGSILKIRKETQKISEDYYYRIAHLSEDELYKKESITNEYKRQLAMKERELEIASKEVELQKAKDKLNNVLAERNVRQIVDGQWQWVVSTEKVREATEELAEAQYSIDNAKRINAQQVSLEYYDIAVDQFNIKIKEAEEGIGDFKNIALTLSENVGKASDVFALFTEFGNRLISGYVKEFIPQNLEVYKSYESGIDYLEKAINYSKIGDDYSAQQMLNKRDAKIDLLGLDPKMKVTLDNLKNFTDFYSSGLAGKSFAEASGVLGAPSNSFTSSLNRNSGVVSIDEETKYSIDSINANIPTKDDVIKKEDIIDSANIILSDNNNIEIVANTITTAFDRSAAFTSISSAINGFSDRLLDVFRYVTNTNTTNNSSSVIFNGGITVNNPADYNSFTKTLIRKVKDSQ